jgi:molybdate transport system permease protein
MGQAAPRQAGTEEAPRGRLPADSALIRRALAGAGVFAASAVALAFLLFPIVAIFARVSPGRLVAQLSRPVVTDALVVSLKTSGIAQALVLLLGTPLAYLLASRRFRGRSLAVVLVELPLVLPPAVAGIGLIAAFGRLGLLGGTLGALGVRLGLTQAAVVIAVAFVASPLYVRQAIAAFEAVDANLVAASRTLGAGPVRTFFRVVLPLARRGLAAGEALSFARGLGEFGATIMFAGSLQGITQTLPLAIYQQFDVLPDGFTTALAMSALLVVVSGALLVTLRLVLQWQPSRPTSRFLFAASR